MDEQNGQNLKDEQEIKNEEVNEESSTPSTSLETKNETKEESKEDLLKKEVLASREEFLSKIPTLIPIENLKQNYRVTPQGLFITQKETKNFVEIYSKENNIPFEKAQKKLFDDENYSIYYLLEGKNCQTGNLVPIEIKEPQKYKLPFYLGSLTNAKNYLHPLDPEIQGFKEFQIKGNDISFKKGDYNYTFSQDLLKNFNRFIDFSPKISKEFPYASKSLQQSLKAFIKLFKKARYVHSMRNFLMPGFCFGNKTYKFAELGTLRFVFDKDNKIVEFYEVNGKNLYYFMRKEFEKIKSCVNSPKMGTFKTFPAKSKFLGQYTINFKNNPLHPYAFFNFIEKAPNMKSMEKYFGKVWTIEKAFETFSYLFINAVPIEEKKISNYIDFMKKYSSKYFINEQWIFGKNKEDVITSCIAKGNHF